MLFTIGRTEYTMGLRSKTQGPDFFGDLTSQVRQLMQAVGFLSHIYITSSRERITLHDQFHEVKHYGDGLNHTIVQRANSSFTTPLDRKGLQSLASHLGDCLDFIDRAGDLLITCDIAGILPSLVSLLNEQIVVTQHCTGLIAENMPKLKSPVDICDYWIGINRLENRDDLAYHHILTTPFNSDLDPVTVIKLKDIVQGPESCADVFEELVSVIESPALKGS